MAEHEISNTDLTPKTMLFPILPQKASHLSAIARWKAQKRYHSPANTWDNYLKSLGKISKWNKLFLNWSLKHGKLQTQVIQLKQKQTLNAYLVSKYHSFPCPIQASVGHIQFGAMLHTNRYVHMQANDSHTWKGKRWRVWGRGRPRLIIHLKICWVLYQNICSNPTTHLYKPIMKPKAIIISPIPTSSFLLHISPPLYVWHTSATSSLSFREKEFLLAD